MIIKSAEYSKSYVRVKDCPDTNIPEFAFIGRSNVGKSSLINYLTGFSKLAKVSRNPGKTQTINYFIINKNWYLVDLPGYGYAKVSKVQRRKWEKMIKDYILMRSQLLYVFQLVDSRIPPQEADLEFINWMGQSAIPFVIVFTKTDAGKRKKVEENIEEFRSKLLESWEDLPIMFNSSSNSNLGREELMGFIENTIIEYRP